MTECQLAPKCSQTGNWVPRYAYLGNQRSHVNMMITDV